MGWMTLHLVIKFVTCVMRVTQVIYASIILIYIFKKVV